MPDTLRYLFRELELAGEWEVFSPQGFPHDNGLPEFSNAGRLSAVLQWWDVR